MSGLDEIINTIEKLQAFNFTIQVLESLEKDFGNMTVSTLLKKLRLHRYGMGGKP